MMNNLVWKKTLFLVMMLFIIWLIVDGMIYICLLKIGKDHSLFYGYNIPNQEDLKKYYDGFFHPVLGWDINKRNKGRFGERKAHVYGESLVYKMKVFGNSFAYGYESEDHETFQFIIEDKTGWECLNYGVSGYGTDQALLKYLHTDIRTEYVIFAIYEENIGRLMTNWWPFYSKGGNHQTKPKFTIVDGKVDLIPNPAITYDDLLLLTDNNYIKELLRNDYWHGYYEKINAPPVLKWPATRTVVPHLFFFVKYFVALVENKVSPSFENSRSMVRYSHLYDKGSKSFVIMKYIVDKFVETANMRMEKPIIIVFPSRRSMDTLNKHGEKQYHSLATYLRERQYNYIDYGDVFLNGNYVQYYRRGYSHFTYEGNKKIAKEIIMKINRLESRKNQD